MTIAFQDGVAPGASYAGMRDTHILSTSPTISYGGSSKVGGSSIMSALMRWDLSSVPPGSTVQSARLVLNVVNTSPQTYELYQLKRNWDESQATWNIPATGRSWELAGARGASDRGSTVLGTLSAAATGPATFTLSAAGVAVVQSWINSPASNFGFILQDYADNDTLQFSSSEVSTLSLRPKFEITYTTTTTTTQNQSPAVSAGADQIVVWPSTATLRGTVSDDGLPNPPGVVTTTWSKLSGPGTVTFASATAVSTTATFGAAGTYVLRLAAFDGALAAADDVIINVSNQTVASKGVWISREEVMALPTSGAAWDRLVSAAATGTASPHIADQYENTDVYTLAKALVGVRTGNQQYLSQVRTTVMAAIGTEAGGRTLALGRNLASYVIAADLVGLDPTQDTLFRAWLRKTLTEVLDTLTLQKTHELRPNNWGTMAGASRAAVAVYLGDQAELARTAQVFKGYLGDRAGYKGFSYGDLSWQADPNNPVGIDPKGATKQGYSIDGVMPDDMRRGGTFQWPPVYTGYPWEALQGVVAQAEILYRAGYDTWQWQDQAVLRAVKFLYGMGWPATGDDQWTPWLIDARYGTHYATNAKAGPGKIMGWTAWTCQNVAAAPLAAPLTAASAALVSPAPSVDTAPTSTTAAAPADLAPALPARASAATGGASSEQALRAKATDLALLTLEPHRGIERQPATRPARRHTGIVPALATRSLPLAARPSPHAPRKTYVLTQLL